MNKRVAIYARVSTDKQTCENQLNELKSIAERMQYIIVDEFIDEGISGATSRQDRPSNKLVYNDVLHAFCDTS